MSRQFEKVISQSAQPLSDWCWFRLVGKGQPRQISESLGEFLSGLLELSRERIWDVRSGFRPATKVY
jgi:hypothetical protein